MYLDFGIFSFIYLNSGKLSTVFILQQTSIFYLARENKYLVSITFKKNRYLEKNCILYSKTSALKHLG